MYIPHFFFLELSVAFFAQLVLPCYLSCHEAFFTFLLSLLALQDVLDGLSKDCNCLSRIVDEKVARNKKCVSHNTFASVWKVRILCAKKYWCLPTVCHTYGYRFASVLKHIFNLPIREFFGLVYARHMVTLSPACG